MWNYSPRLSKIFVLIVLLHFRHFLTNKNLKCYGNILVTIFLWITLCQQDKKLKLFVTVFLCYLSKYPESILC